MGRNTVAAASVVAFALLLSTAAHAKASYSQQYQEWEGAFSSLTSLALTIPIGLSLASFAQRIVVASPESAEARGRVRAIANRYASDLAKIEAGRSTVASHVSKIARDTERAAAAAQLAAIDTFIEGVLQKRSVLDDLSNQTPLTLTPIPVLDAATNEVFVLSSQLVRDVATARIPLAGENSAELILLTLNRGEADTGRRLFLAVIDKKRSAIQSLDEPKALFDQHVADASLIINSAGPDLTLYMDSVQNEVEAAQRLMNLVLAGRQLVLSEDGTANTHWNWAIAVKGWFEYLIHRSATRSHRLK